jgi:hypothetical protein
MNFSFSFGIIEVCGASEIASAIVKRFVGEVIQDVPKRFMVIGRE